MQHKNEKTMKLRKVLGKVIQDFRIHNSDKSKSKIEDEYDLGKSVLYRIENAKFDTKFLTLWKISEAVNVKLSDIIKAIENELGDDFKIMDE